MLTIIDHGQVRELRLDRPPVNALNIELMDGLKQAIVEAGEHFDAIVISGRPGLQAGRAAGPILAAIPAEVSPGALTRSPVGGSGRPVVAGGQGCGH